MKNEKHLEFAIELADGLIILANKLKEQVKGNDDFSAMRAVNFLLSINDFIPLMKEMHKRGMLFGNALFDSRTTGVPEEWRKGEKESHFLFNTQNDDGEKDPVDALIEIILRK